ncbi:MAG: tyrosine--tRNA ligase [Methanomicrobiales archaeon]|mgnify:CR=1 FL=1|jgi:tyrosyl-tRNA synthetase|nr:tyrosine--tRNA ligase [Methanoregulaceae archaeon]HMZ31708.1 tyrosine--tRNA ligase [Methanoregulaceae archaeon]HNB02817.1 tyrosine--tRNA ligase [Methanoregulaceae archaeon]HNI41855.1 tyrosine--tRNA ligase [Methanoregulaceae archaeon]HNJ81456.1 tyrosine--tRNA ligase [Methanoregulaceae archaeon]
MDPYSLVTRNAVEVVTDDELRALLVKSKKRVYAGYEPSGEIHLGHLVTVNKLIDLKEAGFEVVILLADLHAFLNRKGTMERVGELAQYNRRCFEGLGLRDIEYVLGSELQLSPDYQLMVLRLSQQITLNRAKRSMDEVGRNMDAPTVSQMIYPIMQMVDIAQLDVDAAVGGIDQRKIHMLAREHLVNIGYPTPVCIHTPILNGLDGKKMSSSSGNYISVSDSVEEIEKKCQKAFCPPECEENPILQMFQYHIFPRLGAVIIKRPAKFGGDREFQRFEELEEAYRKGEVHPLDLKKAAGTHLADMLSCVRDYV